MTDEQRAGFQKRIETSISDHVYPAYQKLIAYFEGVLPKTTTDDGVWKLPDGEAFYAYALRRSSTTTPLKPDEVHELGLREVARIEGGNPRDPRRQWICRPADRRSVSTRSAKIRGSCSRMTTREGADALAEYTRLIEQAMARSQQLFVTLPKAKIEVRRVPVFKEATSAGAYYQGASIDRTRPGVFYANLRDMNEIPKWGMPTLAYHEGVPGHHFQIATAQELKGLPQFRKLIPFTAYQEGWALYTEWLAKEAGWYEGDPFGDLGRLQGGAFPRGAPGRRHRHPRETLAA